MITFDRNTQGEADRGALRLDFNRRLMLQFRGSAITSDAGCLPIASWTTPWDQPTQAPILWLTRGLARMVTIGWLVVLDMDSSESPAYGEQEGSVYNFLLNVNYLTLLDRFANDAA